MLHLKSNLPKRLFVGFMSILATVSLVYGQNTPSRVYQTANPFITLQAQKEVLPLKNLSSKSQTDTQNSSRKGGFLHELNKSLYVQSEADVLFGSGEVALSSKTREHLDLIVKMFKRDINQHRINFPAEQIVLLVDIKGYTDTKGFYYGQCIAERQTQNKLLSQRRASQVEAYLKKELENTADVIEFQAVGLGEILPESTKNLQANPSLRRSCKIYALLYAECYSHSLVH